MKNVLGFLTATVVILGCGVVHAATAPVLSRDAAVGARYTAPGPRSCSSTKQPASGAITATEARAYVICGYEGVGVESLMLQTHVQVQVASGRPYNHMTDSRLDSVDPNQKVYDIRGSSIIYTCSAPSKIEPVTPRSQLCSRKNTPNNTGKCFRTTFADWKCTWGDLTAPMFGDHTSPPSEAEAN